MLLRCPTGADRVDGVGFAVLSESVKLFFVSVSQKIGGTERVFAEGESYFKQDT